MIKNIMIYELLHSTCIHIYYTNTLTSYDRQEHPDGHQPPSHQEVLDVLELSFSAGGYRD